MRMSWIYAIWCPVIDVSAEIPLVSVVGVLMLFIMRM